MFFQLWLTRYQTRIMGHLSIVTKEFLIPNFSIPQSWLDDLTRVWNECLFIYEWVQMWKRRQEDYKDEIWDIKSCVAIDVKKVENDWVQSCQLIKDYRLDRTKSWNKENLEKRHVCNLVRAEYLDEHRIIKNPPIEKYDNFGLVKLFAKKRCEWLSKSDLPTVYINDFIALVFCTSWDAYLKGQRGKPKYRNKQQDKVRSIKSASFRGQCELCDGDVIRFPGFGKLEIPRVRGRLFDRLDRIKYRMVENPSSYPKLEDKISEIESNEIRKLSKELGINHKELTDEQLDNLRDGQIPRDSIRDKAIEYFSKPGSFSIQSRENKTYLTLTYFDEVEITRSNKSVGVDVGLDLLCHTSSGLKVKHEYFHKEYARIDTLKQIQSRMTYGSNNYSRIQQKIAKIHSIIQRSRSKRQDYFAQQIADVNGFVSVKRIKVKETIGTPIPIYSENKDKYVPNGAKDLSRQNNEISNCALSQFIAKIEQQCRKKQREFAPIQVEEIGIEATPEEVLEVGLLENPPVIAASELAQSYQSENSDNAREGTCAVKRSTTTGKLRATGSHPIIESIAHPPVKVKKKRNRKRDIAIG